MDTRVVELDALADAVGAGSEDQNLGSLGLRSHFGLGLGIELVGRVVVRRLGLELCGAGVDGLVDGAHAKLITQSANGVLTCVRVTTEFGAQSRDLAVRDAVVLGLTQGSLVERLCSAKLFTELVNLLELIEEPRIDLGGVEELLDSCAEGECLLDAVHAAVLRNAQIGEQGVQALRLDVGAGPVTRTLGLE